MQYHLMACFKWRRHFKQTGHKEDQFTTETTKIAVFVMGLHGCLLLGALQTCQAIEHYISGEALHNLLRPQTVVTTSYCT